MARNLSAHTEHDEVRARVLGLPRRFRKDAANGLAAEWELILGERTYTVGVVDRRAFAREGPSLAPAARLTADPATWLAVDDGSLWGVEAFLSRRLIVRGNLDLGARIQTLFEPHGRKRGTRDLEQVQVEAGEHTLSTYVVGEGPAVVLLHGLGGTKVSLLPLLPALADRYRVVVPDLPGHGESSKPVRTDYTPRFYARVVRRMMDTLRLERAVVIGNSLGGRVALELAVRSPDRVRALGLLAPAVPGFRVRYVMGFTRAIPTEFGRVPFPLRERWMRGAVRRLMGDPTRLPPAGYDAAAEEFIRIYRAPEARMAFFDSLRHLLLDPARPFWARMRHVRVPALVVWGTEDRLVSVRLAPRLADALPRAELLVLPGVGHVPQFEATEETTTALVRFLADLRE